MIGSLPGPVQAVAPKRHRSTWDGVWWAVTTMTTVGYGDITPRTNYGRVVAIVVMLVGIGFIALLTGALAHASWPARCARRSTN
jgi:Ion channel